MAKVIFPCFVLTALTFYFAASSAAAPPVSEPDYRIVAARLVSPGVGWATLLHNRGGCSPDLVLPNCPPMRLYLTADNGRHWRNITPPDMVARNISDVFFLDRDHGWFISSGRLFEVEDAPVYLFSTDDGGSSWRSLVLRRPMFNIPDDYAAPSQLFFSDPRHGWMLWHWHMMHSSADYLLYTNNGGRSWVRLPQAPGAGPLQFTSPSDGWMIGMSKSDFGICSPDNDALFVTHDGGNRWEEFRIPYPDGANPQASSLFAFHFKNKRAGFVLLSEQFGDGRYLSTVFSTQNSGKTWQSSTVSAAPQTFSLLDSGYIRSSYDAGKQYHKSLRIQFGSQLVTSAMPDDLPPENGNIFPVFLDPSNAWLNIGRFLLATNDGGRSFHVILPSSGEPNWFLSPHILEVNGIQSFSESEEEEDEASQYRQPAFAGGSMVLQGYGFLPENTIWLDGKQIKVYTDDSEFLSFCLPADLKSGKHFLRVANAHGQSDCLRIDICGVDRPRIIEASSGILDPSGHVRAHRGMSFSLRGCGFLARNIVLFDNTPETLGTLTSDPDIMRVDVPASLVPGTHEVHVKNDNGSSDSVTVVID